MGKNSSISWTDHSFNPWMGCTKVSPGCAHCYAERENIRYGRHIWGPDAPRQRTSENYWKQPLKWNSEAAVAGERRRVFCGSWCDVMEAGAYLDGIRKDLYALIERTSWLDWQLLTKRPENFRTLLPPAWLENPRPNVWLIATVESDAYMWRTGALLEVPAMVHGVSLEPLLGPVDLSLWLPTLEIERETREPGDAHLDWVIAGGESGSGAWPPNPDWFRRVRDDCVKSGVPFFFKQWGEWGAPTDTYTSGDALDGRVHHWPQGGVSTRVGKKAAGHLLDGCEWHQMPEVKHGQ